MGYWNHSYPIQWHYLMSLDVLPNVEVRYYLVPRESVHATDASGEVR